MSIGLINPIQDSIAQLELLMNLGTNAFLCREIQGTCSEDMVSMNASCADVFIAQPKSISRLKEKPVDCGFRNPVNLYHSIASFFERGKSDICTEHVLDFYAVNGETRRTFWARQKNGVSFDKMAGLAETFAKEAAANYGKIGVAFFPSTSEMRGYVSLYVPVDGKGIRSHHQMCLDIQPDLSFLRDSLGKIA